MINRTPQTGLLGRAVLGLFGCVGIFIVGTGLYGSARWVTFALESERTTGVVDRVDRVRSGSRGISYVPVFRYGNADAPIITSSRNGNGWLRYTPGETVQLRIARTPTRAEADPLPTLILFPLVALPFGAIFIALGASPWLGRRVISPILASLWLLALGVAAIWTWSDYAAASNWHRNSDIAEAVVVRHRASSIAQPAGTPPIPTHAPVLRFATEAGGRQEIELAQRRGDPQPPLGATVRLRYALRGPAQVGPDGVWALWRRPAISGAVLILVLVAGGAAMLYRINRSWMKL